ncbi:MAG TPA: hypothetical protein PKM12_00010 [Marmoricola sp.]|nr:hypothetical protein [Marmoricola sp.]HNN47314.1 hypothetical protein [Marmoricola sp.]
MTRSRVLTSRQLSRKHYLDRLSRISAEGGLVLQQLAALEQQRLEQAATTMALAADFVIANPPRELDDVEGGYPLAGEGAPVVAEFAIAVFSASLSMSDFAARRFLGDAVEVRFRLPRLWQLVQDLVVPAWKVRGVCEVTRELGLDAVAWIDEQLAREPARVGLFRIERMAKQAAALFDPQAHAQLEQEIAERRGVFVYPPGERCGLPTAAITRVELLLDTPAANDFEATVRSLAAVLAEQGSEESLDIRRARAVGILADPATAAGLLAGVDVPPPAPARVATTLVVHYSPEQLAAAGVGVEEKLEALSAQLLNVFTRGQRISIRPVINLADNPAVDQHDPTDLIREQVQIRNQVCVFPGCNRDSRSCDLDHVFPYTSSGGPDQTRPSNLAPLCRYHHRVKTHAGWTYEITPEGDSVWTAPDHRQFHKPAVHRRP